MRIAVAGATGNIGARTIAALGRDGHDIVRISRSDGVDLITGDGLDAALAGVDSVVDVISAPPMGPDETREYFATTTTNLLAAEKRAGVRHHVLRSIVGIHHREARTAHHLGKVAQEQLIEAGSVPWTESHAASASKPKSSSPSRSATTDGIQSCESPASSTVCTCHEPGVPAASLSAPFVTS